MENIIKYFLLLVTLIASLFGLFTETKIKINNKERITRSGKALIVFVITSFIGSALLQMIDDRKQYEAKKAQIVKDNEYENLLNQLNRKQIEVLEEYNRTSNENLSRFERIYESNTESIGKLENLSENLKTSLKYNSEILQQQSKMEEVFIDSSYKTIFALFNGQSPDDMKVWDYHL